MYEDEEEEEEEDETSDSVMRRYSAFDSPLFRRQGEEGEEEQDEHSGKGVF